MTGKMTCIHMIYILIHGIKCCNRVRYHYQDLGLGELHIKIACISLEDIRKRVESTITIYSTMT